MHSVLQTIIAHKREEVALLKRNMESDPNNPLAVCLREGYPRREIKSLAKQLSVPCSIIAEIKRNSPAIGMLSEISDPVALAQCYQRAGAAAISVLTDEKFFKGSVEDLKNISFALQSNFCAILRKDFIIDEVQIAQARLYGADAILLIVAVLQEDTQRLLDVAKSYGLEVLLEVHTEEELNIALQTDAQIIGLNNRDLNTLEVDMNTSLRLVHEIPDNIIKVAESGVHHVKSAQLLFAAGYNAILVGEALVRSQHPDELIKAMRERRYVRDED